MYDYQYYILAAFCVLIFFKESRCAALTIFIGLVVYYNFVFDLSAVIYYSLSATIAAIVGFVLNSRYRLISYLNYSLILANLLGLLLYNNGFKPPPYDIICAIIYTVQVLLLIIRTWRNGRFGIYFECALDSLVNFDSRKAHGTM